MRASAKSASGGQPLTPPYLVLHREEFAWPRMSPRAPVRSYRTISPITSRPMIAEAGLFSVALVVAQRVKSHETTTSDAPPLAGSLPCSVRTFLSRLSPAATARPVLLQGLAIIANQCSNGYSTN